MNNEYYWKMLISSSGVIVLGTHTHTYISNARQTPRKFIRQKACVCVGECECDWQFVVYQKTLRRWHFLGELFPFSWIALIQFLLAHRFSWLCHGHIWLTFGELSKCRVIILMIFKHFGYCFRATVGLAATESIENQNPCVPVYLYFRFFSILFAWLILHH